MIEIIKGRIHWHEDFNNPPKLELLVTRIPPVSEHVYEKRGELYYSDVDGVCSFFSWSGGSDRGFGGNQFTLNMKDGTKAVLKGPWSSSASAMNIAGFGPCVEVSLIDDPKGYSLGYTFFAAAVSMEMLGKFRERIAVTPYRINTEGSPWQGFNKVIKFPQGSEFTMLQLGSMTHKMYDTRASGEQSVLIDEGAGLHFVPIVQLPNGKHWIKPRSFKVPIVAPEGSEIVDLKKEPGVWTGGV